MVSRARAVRPWSGRMHAGPVHIPMFVSLEEPQKNCNADVFAEKSERQKPLSLSSYLLYCALSKTMNIDVLAPGQELRQR